MYIFVPEMSCIVVIAEFELGSLVAACLWQSMTVDSVCWRLHILLSLLGCAIFNWAEGKI